MPVDVLSAPRLSPDTITQLEALKTQVLACTQCPLHQGRTKGVFADGNPHARIMFIGEGPGQNEDETGIPFVGRAGQLLTKIIESVGFDRQRDTYIANVVKCRPPGNRVPTDPEMAECWPYLQQQIDLIRPELIVLVGATALRGVLKIPTPISKIRGKWLDTPFYGAKAMAIFHPSYLLRNASSEPNTPKWLTWQDMKLIREHWEQTGS